MSWTQAQVELRHLGVTPGEANEFQALAGHVTFPHPVLRPPESALLAGGHPQSALWVMGISGDLPIVVLTIDDPADLGLVRQLVRGFAYWQLVGFAADLVVVNGRATSYTEELQHELEHLTASAPPAGARRRAASMSSVPTSSPSPVTWPCSGPQRSTWSPRAVTWATSSPVSWPPTPAT